MDFFEMIESQENIDEITGLTSNNDRFTNARSNPMGSSVPVRDVTDQFLVNEELPEGDFRINPAEGIELDFETEPDYGRVVSGLSDIFDPNPTNDFSSIISNAIGDAIIQYLNND